MDPSISPGITHMEGAGSITRPGTASKRVAGFLLLQLRFSPKHERTLMISERAVIEAAILGFEQQKKQIDDTIAELRARLGGTSIAGKVKGGTATKRRRISAEGRKAIAEATRKRWEAYRAAKQKPAPKLKKKMSAARKAALIANLKKAREAKAKKAQAGAS